ncbi:uroporphyrinogen-III synthase [Sedimenticola selenatireducens]|uniref:Uroporphyrinogen-III synthase n=1 Tax=Sedimenticola selenatireducens TaxID=191960 RepID=A0A557SHN1_9GAMM|nr:uroporphyrinogen-III synthase [Sedimenticola selenatireducens]TVO76903.1 uroporphyrinogen-III synthase [Sedimenticola selenatireducens]TVT64346.1 MAG: uroporphyrinogen-III synthase [Sedimenticola selenatireducens]
MSFLSSNSECSLAGIGVLVTRATHQAATLCRLIAAKDGLPLRFPTVEILDPPDPGAVTRQLEQFSRYDIAIFISPNAVLWGLKWAPDQELPEGVALAAVGKRTAQTLAESGYPVDVVPEESFDSEGLLETPELRDVQGKRILILRGNGGRELLGEELSKRGAVVDHVEVYQRACPTLEPDNLIYRWADDVDVVTVTSNILLDNLFTLLGVEGRPLLLQTPMVVVSDRMRQHARELGCSQIILAPGADEQDLIKAICQWVSNRN